MILPYVFTLSYLEPSIEQINILVYFYCIFSILSIPKKVSKKPYPIGLHMGPSFSIEVVLA